MRVVSGCQFEDLRARTKPKAKYIDGLEFNGLLKESLK